MASASEKDDGERDVRVVHVQHAGRVGGDPEDRPDREVDVPGDDDDRLADREQRDDRGAREDLLEVRGAEEEVVVERRRRRRRSRARARCRARGSARGTRRARASRSAARRRSAPRRPTSRGLLDQPRRGAHDRVLVRLRARELAHDAALEQHDDRGRPCRAPRAARTRSSGRRRPARRARRAGGAPRPSCRRRCRASARRRSAASACAPSHFASTIFCWLPPESVQTGFVSFAYFSCRRSAQSRAKRALGAAEDEPASLNAVERGERDVALDREVHHEALLAPVLGHERRCRPPSRPSASPAAAACRRSRPSRRPSGRCRRSRARPRSGRRRRARRARRSRRSARRRRRR